MIVSMTVAFTEPQTPKSKSVENEGTIIRLLQFKKKLKNGN
jgi:hypothetical protein